MRLTDRVRIRTVGQINYRSSGRVDAAGWPDRRHGDHTEAGDIAVIWQKQCTKLFLECNTGIGED